MGGTGTGGEYWKDAAEWKKSPETASEQRERELSPLELHIQDETRFRKAKCVLCSESFTPEDDVRIIPIRDSLYGEVERPYHKQCVAEYNAQQRQKKAEQHLNSIADTVQTQVNGAERERREDLQERLRIATELIERAEPKKVVSLKGLGEAFFELIPIIGTIYNNNIKKTTEDFSVNYDYPDLDIWLYARKVTTQQISDWCICVAGLSILYSESPAINATIIPIALTFKACTNYIIDKYRQYVLKKEYESFKQQIEAQTRTNELPEKTKPANETKVKQDE